MRGVHSLGFSTLALLAVLGGLSACDGGASDPDSGEPASGHSPLATASPGTCTTELSRAAAGSLVGTSLPDSGHRTTASSVNPTRHCEWSAMPGGLSSRTSVTWLWQSSPTIFENMKKNYAENRVRTLADGRICTREAAFDVRYLYRVRQVAGRETMSVEFADSTCSASGFDEQVWTVCRGTTVQGSVDHPTQTTAWKFQKADSLVARICQGR